MAGDLMTSVEGSRDLQSTPLVDPSDPQGRRMSDPVRPLDRNFGVGGQLSRHRSFGNLGGGAAGGRAPLHNQRVRGQEGFMDPAQQQQQAVNQVNTHLYLEFNTPWIHETCYLIDDFKSSFSDPILRYGSGSDTFFL